MRFAAGGAEVSALFLAWPGRNVDSGPGIAYNKSTSERTAGRKGPADPAPAVFPDALKQALFNLFISCSSFGPIFPRFVYNFTKIFPISFDRMKPLKAICLILQREGGTEDWITGTR